MARKQKPPKPKAKKGKQKVVSVGKKVLQQLQLSSRVSNLEKQLKSLLDVKKDEAQFQAGLMFGVNALVDVLQSKNIITMDELELARIKTIQEYQQEKIAEVKRAEIAKRYKHDPVHYDSTLDKWFVFAPNWKDKVGPFLEESAAREALRIIRGDPDPNAKPEAEPDPKPAEPGLEDAATSAPADQDPPALPPAEATGSDSEGSVAQLDPA